jgi:hypothetical protein
MGREKGRHEPRLPSNTGFAELCWLILCEGVNGANLGKGGQIEKAKILGNTF